MLKNYAQEENVKFPWRKKNTTESAPYHYFITKKLFKWNHIVSLCSWKLCKILRVAVRFASFLLLGFVSQTLNLIGNGVIREVNVFIFLSLSQCHSQFSIAQSKGSWSKSFRKTTWNHLYAIEICFVFKVEFYIKFSSILNAQSMMCSLSVLMRCYNHYVASSQKKGDKKKSLFR